MNSVSKLTRNICCALAGAAVLSVSFAPAEACFTIVAGKDATVSGKVLMAHNEDNGGRIVVTQHKVPRMTHAGGEMIAFEKTSAKIPQVKETLAYYWSEARNKDGSSFCDYFMNERGVAITSDNCVPSREDKPDLKDGGIGYGIRKLVAERATSARHGVEIAARLIEEYGYNSSGRSYQIADKDEAWMLQIVNGKQYVAKRIADAEVALIPNHYTIRQVNLKDKKNYIVSPTLVTYAMDRGWYIPKKSGDTSDFDFAKAYQLPERYEYKSNIYRHQYAVEMLTKKPYQDKQYPFSVVLDHKIGKADVKAVLASHFEGTKDDLSTNELSPHFTDRRVICTATTLESSIVEFNDNNALNVVWRAFGHPCTSPYIPLFVGMKQMPASMEWMDAKAATATHFSVPKEDYSYHGDRAYYKFQDIENIVDPQYRAKAPQVTQAFKKLEKNFDEELPAVLAKADALSAKDPDKALDYITRYTHEAAAKAEGLAQDLYKNLARNQIAINVSELKKGVGNPKLEVTVFSDAAFDARSIDVSTLKFGASYTKTLERTAAEATRYADVNQDGRPDLIATFNADKVIKNVPAGYMDLWLSGMTKKQEHVVAEGFVTVKE